MEITTIKQITWLAAEVKRSASAHLGVNCSRVAIGGDQEAALLHALAQAHPSGDRITEAAQLWVGKKPRDCVRPGTSDTCFFVSLRSCGKLHPVWFADCRAGIWKDRSRVRSA